MVIFRGGISHTYFFHFAASEHIPLQNPCGSPDETKASFVLDLVMQTIALLFTL